MKGGADMTILIPADVQSIIEKIEAHGHSAYIVGGCVRDAIMGRQPHDYDICTSALPDEVLSIFSNRRVIETGLQHGTVTVQGDTDYYEVTTYRVDGEYTDGRHPDEVKFVSDVVADLARRDFTINAMAYNAHTGLIDPFGGYEDIKNKLIRSVGCAEHRFQEDALRIMRAVRFAATCGFAIHDDTHNAMLNLRHLLVHVSEERKTTEFLKMLVCADADLLIKYRDVFSTFIPELIPTFDFKQNNPHHIYDVYAHTVHAVAEAPQDAQIRLSLMFHDIAKPLVYSEDENGIGHFYGHADDGAVIAKNIMKRMRLDNDTIDIVSGLIAAHDITLSTSPKFTRRMISKMGELQFRRLIEVIRADKMAQSKNTDTMTNLGMLISIEYNIGEALSKNECLTLKDLAVNGHDLIAVGITDGKMIGATLQYLLETVLSEPCKNVKETLISMALKLHGM